METISKTEKDQGALAWASDSAPNYCEAISDLYSWASNYLDMKPFRKFLDLVGYSEQEFAHPLDNWSDPSDSLGYVEMSKLGESLVEWSNRPLDCEAWVSELLSVESEFGL
jgi:hypothetical protein